jgi:putative N6-adenine-specific DNA methylase
MKKMFAVCAPGLEAVLARELQGLGLLKGFTLLRESGGVSFSGRLRDLYRANLLLRSAERVLAGIGGFEAGSLPELRRGAAGLPWRKYLSADRPVSVRVLCRGSRIFHRGEAAARVAAAISESLGQAPEGGAAQLVFVRIEKDLCSVSVDSSGELLHRRGYRLAGAKAPLSESLAGALVLASGWDRRGPLLDPFCGSGTIAIEAALLAAGLAPGRARRFAFMDWDGFDEEYWEGVKAETEAAPAAEPPRILASDRDAGAVAAARANAERAGVAGRIEFSCRAVSAVEPPAGPGWVVSNPPYGVRIQGKGELRDLYAQLGKVLRSKCPGWRACLLCASPPLLRATGLPFEAGLATVNGGLAVRVASCSV